MHEVPELVPDVYQIIIGFVLGKDSDIKNCGLNDKKVTSRIKDWASIRISSRKLKEVADKYFCENCGGLIEKLAKKRLYSTSKRGFVFYLLERGGISLIPSDWELSLMPLRQLCKNESELDELDEIVLKRITQDGRKFSEKQIQCMLEEVCENNLGRSFRFLLKHERVNPSKEANRVVIIAARNGNVPFLLELMTDPRVDPSAQANKALKLAALRGHHTVIEALLKDHRVKPQVDDNQAFRIAAENGRDQVVKLLLSDERVNPSSHQGEALRMASQGGFDEVVKILLKHPMVDPTVQENQPIVLASTYGHLNVVKVLLADSRTNPSDKALFAAVSKNHLEVVEELLKHPKTDPTLVLDQDILIDSRILEVLLKDGRANPQFILSPTFTNMRLRSDLNHDHLLDLLFNDGRIDFSVNENDIIKKSCYMGYSYAVKRLLQDDRVNPSVNGNEPLRWAALMGHLSIVKMLLEHPQVDPSDRNNEAIRKASKCGHASIVEELLKHPKVDPTVSNNSPIEKAVRYNRTSVFQVLLKDPRVVPTSQTMEYARSSLTKREEILRIYDQFKSSQQN